MEKLTTEELRQGLITLFINKAHSMSEEEFCKSFESVAKGSISYIPVKSRQEQIQRFTNGINDSSREELLSLANRLVYKTALKQFVKEEKRADIQVNI